MAGTIVVTRHPAVVEWVKRRGVAIEAVVDHADGLCAGPGDKVVGVLPLHLAARLCAAGAECWHVVMDLPREWRGKELSADEMEAANARLERYMARRA